MMTDEECQKRTSIAEQTRWKTSDLENTNSRIIQLEKQMKLRKPTRAIGFPLEGQILDLTIVSEEEQ